MDATEYLNYEGIKFSKCFGAGTEVLLFDGRVKTVEDLQVGDVLMGDDSTPRTVLSTSRGNTAADEARFLAQPAATQSLQIKDGHTGSDLSRRHRVDGKFESQYVGCDFTTTDKQVSGKHELLTSHAQLVARQPAPATYMVRSSNAGHPDFTVNGEHVLVLRLELEPWVERAVHSPSYVIKRFVLQAGLPRVLTVGSGKRARSGTGERSRVRY